MRRLVGLLLAVLLAACGGSSGSSPSLSTGSAPATATFTVQRIITESTLTESVNRPIPSADARVEVVDGANAGKATSTSRSGSYSLGGLAQGALTLRASKNGFQSKD